MLQEVTKEKKKKKQSSHPVFSCLSILPLGPQKVAPIPPFLSPGQHGGLNPSCSGSCGLPSPFSCSCCSLLDSSSLYPCQRKTTAVPAPTTSPDHSTLCSDTPMVLLRFEASRCPLHKCWQHEGNRAQSTPRSLEKTLILTEGLLWHLQLSSLPCVNKTNHAFAHGW